MKTKLEAGQVWQVRDEKWIRVRAITIITNVRHDVFYLDLGGRTDVSAKRKVFLRWIRRNNAKFIGMVNSETGRVKVVK